MGAFPQQLNAGNRRYVIDQTIGAVASQTFRVEGGMNRYIHEVTVCTSPDCGRGAPDREQARYRGLYSFGTSRLSSSNQFSTTTCALFQSPGI